MSVLEMKLAAYNVAFDRNAKPAGQVEQYIAPCMTMHLSHSFVAAEPSFRSHAGYTGSRTRRAWRI
jgi:hypothetical protein